MSETLLIVIAVELLVLLDRLGWGFRKFSWQSRVHIVVERRWQDWRDTR